jgi:DNA-binding NtrC family response regulator
MRPRSITTEWLPSSGSARAPAAAPGPNLRVPLGTPLADVEQRLILQTLRHYGNHRERTAAALGVSLKTLNNKPKTYESDGPKPPRSLRMGSRSKTRTTA